MPIRSANFAEALEPVILRAFEVGMAMRPPVAPQLFNVQNSGNDHEKILGIGGMGIDVFDNYENANTIGELDFDKGYLKTYTHKEYPAKITVQRKFMADNQLPQILAIAQRAGMVTARKREVDAASVFNNAFSASYLGADAVALCSDSHPHSPDHAASTQDNNFALSLTKANLRTVREAMMAFTDDHGNKLAITPDLLLVPPALEDDALPIVQSVLDPTSANNATNPMAGRFRVVPWHYLTDSNAWFLIDSVQMRLSLDWFNREPIQLNREVRDETISISWIIYQRYSYGWSDWRWVAGSNPS